MTPHVYAYLQEPNIPLFIAFVVLGTAAVLTVKKLAARVKALHEQPEPRER